MNTHKRSGTRLFKRLLSVFWAINIFFLTSCSLIDSISESISDMQVDSPDAGFAWQKNQGEDSANTITESNHAQGGEYTGGAYDEALDKARDGNSNRNTGHLTDTNGVDTPPQTPTTLSPTPEITPYPGPQKPTPPPTVFVAIGDLSNKEGVEIYWDFESMTAILSTGLRYTVGINETYIGDDNKLYVKMPASGDEIDLLYSPEGAREDWVSWVAYLGVGFTVYYVAEAAVAKTIELLAPTAMSYAIEAAEQINNFYLKAKHLADHKGGFAKFATTDRAVVNEWVAEALRSASDFVVNSNDSYYTVVDMGQAIGTKGEEFIKVVFTTAGNVITAYPVK